MREWLYKIAELNHVLIKVIAGGNSIRSLILVKAEFVTLMQGACSGVS